MSSEAHWKCEVGPRQDKTCLVPEQLLQRGSGPPTTLWLSAVPHEPVSKNPCIFGRRPLGGVLAVLPTSRSRCKGAVPDCVPLSLVCDIFGAMLDEMNDFASYRTDIRDLVFSRVNCSKRV